MLPNYLFLDIETTGTDSRVDQITEIALITSGGTERAWFVAHDRLPCDWVLTETDYITRILPGPKDPLCVVLQQIVKIAGASATWPHLVGANPSFDDRFLRKGFSDHASSFGGYHLDANPPWNYHLIDVEAMAMQKFHLAVPPKLKNCRTLLGIEEWDTAHTALGDARNTKRVFEALLR